MTRCGVRPDLSLSPPNLCLQICVYTSLSLVRTFPRRAKRVGSGKVAHLALILSPLFEFFTIFFQNWSLTHDYPTG